MEQEPVAGLNRIYWIRYFKICDRTIFKYFTSNVLSALRFAFLFSSLELLIRSVTEIRCLFFISLSPTLNI